MACRRPCSSRCRRRSRSRRAWASRRNSPSWSRTSSARSTSTGKRSASMARRAWPRNNRKPLSRRPPVVAAVERSDSRWRPLPLSPGRGPGRGFDDPREVELARREATYSYKDGDAFVFMDNEDYTQYALDASAVGEAAGYITDGLAGCFVQLIEDAPVAVQLPPNVVLTVVDTPPEL